MNIKIVIIVFLFILSSCQSNSFIGLTEDTENHSKINNVKNQTDNNLPEVVELPKPPQSNSSKECEKDSDCVLTNFKGCCKYHCIKNSVNKEFYEKLLLWQQENCQDVICEVPLADSCSFKKNFEIAICESGKCIVKLDETAYKIGLNKLIDANALR